MEGDIIQYTCLYWYEVTTYFVILSIGWKIFDLFLHGIMPNSD